MQAIAEPCIQALRRPWHETSPHPHGGSCINSQSWEPFCTADFNQNSYSLVQEIREEKAWWYNVRGEVRVNFLALFCLETPHFHCALPSNCPGIIRANVRLNIAIPMLSLSPRKDKSTPDPDTFEKYRDTPPMSIAILCKSMQKY